MIPVRWTAPEGLNDQKYSSASDVWSFGITCIEIFQDAVTPYIDFRSNPAVMAMINAGKVHPQPPGCSDQVYAELVRCFSFEPAERPDFSSLQVFFTRMVHPDNSIALQDTGSVLMQPSPLTMAPTSAHASSTKGTASLPQTLAQLLMPNSAYASQSEHNGALAQLLMPNSAYASQSEHKYLASEHHPTKSSEVGDVSVAVALTRRTSVASNTSRSSLVNVKEGFNPLSQAVYEDVGRPSLTKSPVAQPETSDTSTPTILPHGSIQELQELEIQPYGYTESLHVDATDVQAGRPDLMKSYNATHAFPVAQNLASENPATKSREMSDSDSDRNTSRSSLVNMLVNVKDGFNPLSQALYEDVGRPSVRESFILSTPFPVVQPETSDTSTPTRPYESFQELQELEIQPYGLTESLHADATDVLPAEGRPVGAAGSGNGRGPVRSEAITITNSNCSTGIHRSQKKVSQL